MGDRFMNLNLPFSFLASDDVICASIEYRLAPQHPFPGPTEDCYAVHGERDTDDVGGYQTA
ncbi:uncharacterized protein BO97DRAFT_425630 [Aspergillus homomorphus CBS 101889]|uniref:Alpha/beta hydrolase fold-3 domain-containing protein n=1 Tax=Aspergillus homomorphus (strain CBS 101889) TaxID=1450537 RepID=A0A395HUX0_ASPHC|nr:hypothetical protein BO97DRAFT_425630 [Aspergillus homomorphus CBS 101889]RAL11316.1 hypothetical protein BO97DRAFT_425630 [Aspergillus homomorphus CBS 101889]